MNNTSKMSLKVSIEGLDWICTAVPLEGDAFAPFGEVIQNPKPDLHPSKHPALLKKTASASQTAETLPFDGVSANQGTAIKYQHVTRMVNLYDQAPSKKPGLAVMNMFVCAARKPVSSAQGQSCFGIGILERHPYTTQTFSPLTGDPDKRYLVIVAPSLSPRNEDDGLPVPSSGIPHGRCSTLPGRGLPDVRGLKAFVATADQAVTYGAGTWHAPMVALGPEGSTVDFVVTQFANGVGIEDCQEVVLKPLKVADSGYGHPGVFIEVQGIPRLSKL